MKTKFDDLFASDLMLEEQRDGDVEISDSDFIFCAVDDCLAQNDGKALDRAKYIVNAVNLHHEMYEMLESIREDYGGTHITLGDIDNLLAKARGEHGNNN